MQRTIYLNEQHEEMMRELIEVLEEKKEAGELDNGFIDETKNKVSMGGILRQGFLKLCEEYGITEE